MKTIIVIPARYKSTRLPKKPLADIAGEPLIVRTVRNVEKCNLPYLVAYDAYEIGEVLAKYKIPALKTSEKYAKMDSLPLKEWKIQAERYTEFNQAISGLIMNALANIRLKELEHAVK